MKGLVNLKGFIALFSILLVVVVAATSAQVKKKPVLRRRATAHKAVVPAEKVYAVEKGSTLHVRMNSTLNSKTAHVGQTFTVTVTEPVYSSTGVVVIPNGSTIVGRVDTVRPAFKGGEVGQIGVSFIQVDLPNGRKRTINGSLADLDTKTAKSDNESTASGSVLHHRKLIFTGGGGVGGALLGGAIGGGRGALIGAIVGGVGGYVANNETRGQEAVVTAGTEFGVLLDQTVSLPRFVEVTTP